MTTDPHSSRGAAVNGRGERESLFQKKVRDFLHEEGCWTQKTMWKGYPDLICFYPKTKQLFFLEIKRDSKKYGTSKAQKETMLELYDKYGITSLVLEPKGFERFCKFFKEGAL